jgi:hypothetical protein
MFYDLWGWGFQKRFRALVDNNKPFREVILRVKVLNC